MISEKIYLRHKKHKQKRIDKFDCIEMKNFRRQKPI